MTISDPVLCQQIQLIRDEVWRRESTHLGWQGMSLSLALCGHDGSSVCRPVEKRPNRCRKAECGGGRRRSGHRGTARGKLTLLLE